MTFVRTLCHQVWMKMHRVKKHFNGKAKTNKTVVQLDDASSSFYLHSTLHQYFYLN